MTAGRLTRVATTVLVSVAFILPTEVAASGATPCGVATITWDGGAGTTSWHTATNWTGDRLPGSQDHVCIPASSVTVVYSTGTLSVRGVEAAGGLRLNGGTLRLTDVDVASRVRLFTLAGGVLGGDATLVISGPSSWTAGGMWDGGATEIAAQATLTISTTSTKQIIDTRRLVNAGTIDWQAGNISGAFGVVIDNRGDFFLRTAQTFSGTNGPSIWMRLVNTGRLIKTGAGTAVIGAITDSPGVVEVEAGTLQVGLLENFSSSGWALQYGTFRLKGIFRFSTDTDIASWIGIETNRAHIVLEGTGAGMRDQFGGNPLRILNRNLYPGRLEVRNGATLAPAPLSGNNRDLVNTGEIVIGTSSRLAVLWEYRQLAGTTTLESATSRLAAGSGLSLSGGTLLGQGIIENSLTNSSALVAAVGDVPASLTFQAGYTQGGSGALRLGVAPAGADALVVTGSAVLGGNIALVTQEGYVPPVGTEFPIVTYDDRSGSFAKVDGARLDGGLLYWLQNNGGAVTATVQPQSVADWGEVIINGGASTTNSRNVTLDFELPGSVTPTGMRLANDRDPTSALQAFASPKTWTLSSGEGERQVRAQFRDAAGNLSSVRVGTIVLDTTAPQASVAEPTDSWSEGAVAFNEPVRGVDSGNVVLRIADTSTNLPLRLACEDAAGEPLECSSGGVTTVRLQPETPLAPLLSYTILVNPTTASHPVRDLAGNAVRTTSKTFRT